MNYFSVKRATKLFGKVYLPCISYKVTLELEATVNKMEAEGNAVVFDEKVIFRNGTIVPTAKMIDARIEAEEKLLKEKEKARKLAEKEAKKLAKAQAEAEEEVTSETADETF